MSFLYKLYTGDETNLGSVDTIEDETFESQGTDIEELTVAGKSPGEPVYSNVLAEHIATGKKAVYDVLLTTILNPDITSIEASPSSITGDPADTGSISWDVFDNGETTVTQRECTPISLDTDIVTISNINKTARTADYTLQTPVDATTTKIRVVSDFNNNIFDEIDVEVTQVEVVNDSQEFEFTTA